MKSEYQIRMDFQRASDVAGDLRSIAKNTRDAANLDLQGALTRIKGSWEGENSDAFQTKGDRLRQQVVDLADDVESIAKAIEQIAENTYQAEMRAIRIAEETSGQ